MSCLDDKTLFKALELWGGELQLNVLIEEMAELTQAIVKRNRGNSHNIDEEIADVEIMLEQAKLYLRICDEVEKWKDYKMARLSEKLKKIEDSGILD